MTQPLLEVANLVTEFSTDQGTLRAVDGVSFQIRPGEILGIVGESGCGKSVAAMSILGLVSEPGRIRSGEIRLRGRDLARLSEAELRSVRGAELGVIFQDPSSALNPVYTVGYQVREALLAHRQLSAAAAQRRTIELLDRVGIHEAARRVDLYPHEMSGGMRQRVMIAMALACEPQLLIADEPTTALDVTVQTQILALIESLAREAKLGVLLITHDFGVVSRIASHVAVMYAGRVVETASSATLLSSPRHPYTRGLLRCVQALERGDSVRRLPTIPGMVPDLRELPMGCAFAPRCEFARPRCGEAVPELVAVSELAHGERAPGEERAVDADALHRVACVRADELDRYQADHHE